MSSLHNKNWPEGHSGRECHQEMKRFGTGYELKSHGTPEKDMDPDISKAQAMRSHKKSLRGSLKYSADSPAGSTCKGESTDGARIRQMVAAIDHMMELDLANQIILGCLLCAQKCMSSSLHAWGRFTKAVLP